MTNTYYPPLPRQKKTLQKETTQIILVRPKLQYACSAWDLQAALERVQAMCMVYSVDYTDFRHNHSVLLLLEKYRSH